MSVPMEGERVVLDHMINDPAEIGNVQPGQSAMVAFDGVVELMMGENVLTVKTGNVLFRKEDGSFVAYDGTTFGTATKVFSGKTQNLTFSNPQN